jgi:hypothetical protein
LVHQATAAALVAEIGRAVHQLLLRQGQEGAALTHVLALKRTRLKKKQQNMQKIGKVKHGRWQ